METMGLMTPVKSNARGPRGGGNRSCPPADGFRGDSGAAMLAVVVVFLFLLPVSLAFLKHAVSLNTDSVKERNLQSARVISNNVMVDVMRQFSSDTRQDYYDPFYLKRTSVDQFLGLGEASTRYLASRLNRYIYFSSQGKYLPGAAGSTMEKSTKGLEAVVEFASDVARFGAVWRTNPVPLAASGPYDGETIDFPLYVIGDLDTSLLTMTISATVVVTGNFIAGSGTKLKAGARILCGGPRCAEGVVNAHPNAIVSTGRTKVEALPDPDLSYYLIHNATRTLVNDVFNLGETDSTSTSSGIVKADTFLAPWIVPKTHSGDVDSGNLPGVVISNGGVYLAQDSNLRIKADATFPGIRGRITIICTGTPGLNGTGTGNVTVQGDLEYAGTSSDEPSNNRALAVFAQGRITFEDSNDQTVNGIFYSASNDIVLVGNSGDKFTLNGTLDGMISASSFDNWDINHQVAFKRFPPPMMPVHPSLVLWRQRGSQPF